MYLDALGAMTTVLFSERKASDSLLFPAGSFRASCIVRLLTTRWPATLLIDEVALRDRGVVKSLFVYSRHAFDMRYHETHTDKHGNHVVIDLLKTYLVRSLFTLQLICEQEHAGMRRSLRIRAQNRPIKNRKTHRTKMSPSALGWKASLPLLEIVTSIMHPCSLHDSSRTCPTEGSSETENLQCTNTLQAPILDLKLSCC